MESHPMEFLGVVLVDAPKSVMESEIFISVFATLPDLRPPLLQGKWWGTMVQITCQKVGHIRFGRSNPFPSSPVSDGLNQVMKQEKCNFLTRNAYFHR